MTHFLMEIFLPNSFLCRFYLDLNLNFDFELDLDRAVRRRRDGSRGHRRGKSAGRVDELFKRHVHRRGMRRGGGSQPQLGVELRHDGNGARPEDHVAAAQSSSQHDAAAGPEHAAKAASCWFDSLRTRHWPTARGRRRLRLEALGSTPVGLH